MYKIEEYHGIEYQIYDNGDVYRNHDKYHVKQHKDSYGYLIVNLGTTNDRSCYSVHRLVGKAFITNLDESKNTINHIDRNKENNNVENLEWVSREFNASDSFNNPNHKLITGESKSFKLNKFQVLEIKSMLELYTNKELAEKYNVSKTTIFDIRRKRAWKNVN